MKSFAEDLNFFGKPFIYDNERRISLLAQLEVIFAKLYDLDL